MRDGEKEEFERCSYVLPKKKRKCRMLVKPGQQFCGEHQIHDPENKSRVICPNDPSHTVSLVELVEHLKNKCNARISNETWIVEGLNAVKKEVAAYEPIDLRPTKEHISSVVTRLLDLQTNYLGELVQRQCAQIDDFISSHEELGPVQRKHLIQQASIIGHLIEAGLLVDAPTTSIVELGAGKAQLAYWMAKVAPKAKFLLIDRSGSRNKYDNKALQEDTNLEMRRLRCSIEHLDSSKVEIIQDCHSLVAVEKHFCGSATDAGIRCLQNGVNRGLKLKGFVLAPCCHHKMRYDEYVGIDYLCQQGFNGVYDFAALRHVSTWSVCGFNDTEHETPEEKLSPQNPLEDGETTETPWSQAFRAKVGRQAKLLLEEGRADHLRKLGYQVNLIEYVPTHISPENLLLIGIKNNVSE